MLNNLALSYRASGQIQKAIEAYEEVLEIKTGNKATPVLSLSTRKCDTLLSVLKISPFDVQVCFLSNFIIATAMTCLVGYGHSS